MRSAPLVLATILAGSIVAGAAPITAATWDSHGPWGGLVLRIRIDPAEPGRLLAHTSRGSYLSVNGGGRWRRISDV